MIMELLKGLLYGVVQGLIEFLPISSSGCLHVLFPASMQEGGQAFYYSTFLHAGTLAVLLIWMRKSVKKMLVVIRGMLSRRPQDGSKKDSLSASDKKATTGLLIASPVMLLTGFLLRKIAFTYSTSHLVTAMGCFVTAIFLVVAAILSREDVEAQPGSWRYVIIGLASGVGVLPGLSRVGMCYSVSRMCGYGKKPAAAITYLLAIPACIGALLYDIWQMIMVGYFPVGSILTGIIASFAVGYLMFPRASRLLRRLRPSVFAFINIVIGLVFAILYVQGV